MIDAEILEPKDQRRGIQSVEVGFELVSQLAAAPGKLPLKKLAELAGMTPSKAHLYLVSFQRLGLVVQDGATSHYGLGPTALQHGLAAINQLNVVDIGREMLPEALEETGASISVCLGKPWRNHRFPAGQRATSPPFCPCRLCFAAHDLSHRADIHGTFE